MHPAIGYQTQQVQRAIFTLGIIDGIDQGMVAGKAAVFNRIINSH